MAFDLTEDFAVIRRLVGYWDTALFAKQLQCHQ
jgi:hypothetical protein